MGVPAFLVRSYRQKWYFGPLVVFVVLMALLILCVVFKMENGRLWLRDFEVYWKAGERVVAGEDLYRIEDDGHYRYKYSPTAATYFSPLSAMPFPAAQVVYWFLLSLVIVFGLCLAARLACPRLEEDPRRTNSLFLLAALILGVTLAAELTLGQVNQLLIVAGIAMAWLYGQGRPWTLALVWSLTLFLKPLYLIFVPYFIVKKRFRELGGLALFTFLLLALPLLFFRNLDMLAGQNREWFAEIGGELSDKQDLLKAGNHTIFSVLARYTPLRLIDPDPQGQLLIKGLILAAIALVVIWVIYRGRHQPRAFVLEFALLMGLVPLLSYTSENAFGFIELSLFVLLFGFSRYALPSRALIVTGIILFVAGSLRFVSEAGRAEDYLELFKSLSLITIGVAMLLAALIAGLYGKKAQAVIAGVMLLLLLSALAIGSQGDRSSKVEESGPAGKYWHSEERERHRELFPDGTFYEGSKAATGDIHGQYMVTREGEMVLKSSGRTLPVKFDARELKDETGDVWIRSR